MHKENLINNYGFTTDQHGLKIAQYFHSEKQTQQQRTKWLQLIPKIKSIKIKDQKLIKEMVRQGVLDSFRDKVWAELISPPLKPYSFYCGRQQLKEIDLDLQRTIPTHKNANNIIPYLRRLLNAIALAFPQMGYCQGLNFIAVTLLFKLDEQKAFDISYHILHRQGHAKLLMNLDKIHQKVYVLEKLIRKSHPKLFKRLVDKEINTLFYATSWFITLFCGVLPCNYCLRIIEMYLLEGEKILYRVALQIMKVKKARLKQLKQFQDFNEQLKNFDEFDLMFEDTFFSEMFEISLSRKQIENYEQEYLKVKKEQ